ncbi:ComEA family DNA-binding protein [Klenkia sp. PcliD-1-E]|uniref:ComEA family DNA-binding protein n=1 Tax=Klenkia sp. PcliD-1-E TaxID=2954492 RepID=UPI002097B9E5|nr:ComEA family DNA-binding protein [Klenkia sp. PcliD-1-E]MCO7220636.1 helix-hairpin-helix domain-containing protein [Klenkia sp. PcliD-1-E]
MLFSSRRTDDADVIRARLRALLDEGTGRRGWLPDDLPDGPPRGGRPTDDLPADEFGEDDDGEDDDAWTTAPATAVTEPVGPGSTAAPTTGRHRAAGAGTRLDPGPHGTRTLWLVAVLAAVAVALWSWTGRPDVAPVDGGAVPAASTTSPDPTSGPPAAGTTAPPADVVVVSVVGLVVSPGLVTLPAGSRVADALAAAGGLLPGTDPAAVNAAALLTDGQQIAVGVPGAADPGSPGTGIAPAAGTVDLNTATLADLDGLPGIGPVLAQRILDHRAQHGPFGSVQELDDVSGIGPALFAEVSPLVSV